jgi:hypothetical protein
MDEMRLVQEWSGPARFEMKLVSIHTRVIRYRTRLNEHDFDAYVPKVLIGSFAQQAIPNTIIVTIGKTPFPLKEIGFTGDGIPCRTDPNFWEYDSYQEKVHSERYRAYYSDQMYSLYLPKEIFTGLEAPTRVLMQVEKAMEN